VKGGGLMVNRIDKTATVIDIQHLSKFFGEREVLKDINFSVKKGEVVSIIGSSGSGKSTLMNILGCLDRLDSGSYYLNSKDVSNLNENELAYIRNKEIGFVFQSFNLLPRMSILENVELPMIYAGVSLKERKQRALEALEKVGLSDRIHHKSNEISGGQKQRISIARGVLKNSSVLILDDATSALDAVTEAKVIENLKPKSRKQTVITITQRCGTAMFADQILVMDNGVKVGYGTHEQLMKNCDVYRDIYKTQIEGSWGI